MNLNTVPAQMAMKAMTQHKVMARIYRGPRCLSNMYEAKMEEVLETALMNARAAARLAGGRGMVLEIQPRATT